ncbi:hypothetical protein [Lactobacillus sp. ESL0681]|uniref:hypothetical protein n=1 Tax=Lactobacillus sp. ESL0681 TaxID=2983211 RepID=UPI0023F6CD9E|nr:hypothetical protein [Lactobacillus sp. ESL0681]WEV40374.1 hypothetical protein OZX59_00205 [Lactobacillus sp. ESL0681]
MSTKEIFDIIYALLFVVAILVGVYATKHTSNNKLVSTVESLAAAFVRQYETTDASGSAKMKAVINSVSETLEKSGHKVDPTVIAMIEAFAEKEVAKMNADKPVTVTPTIDEDTAKSVDGFNEDEVKDLTEGVDADA